MSCPAQGRETDETWVAEGVSSTAVAQELVRGTVGSLIVNGIHTQLWVIGSAALVQVAPIIECPCHTVLKTEKNTYFLFFFKPTVF